MGSLYAPVCLQSAARRTVSKFLSIGSSTLLFAHKIGQFGPISTQCLAIAITHPRPKKRKKAGMQSHIYGGSRLLQDDPTVIPTPLPSSLTNDAGVHCFFIADR